MSKKVVVIGSGPGGYVAAIRLSQLGHEVTVIEKDAIGGTCLNVGCIPSKALIHAGHQYKGATSSGKLGIESTEVRLNFSQTQQWKNTEVVAKLTQGIAMLLKKNKANVIRGSASFKDGHTVQVISDQKTQDIVFDHAIIATGSRPIELKEIPFDDQVGDSTHILNLKEVPDHLVVIGGGTIGCELANAYANLGSSVTILEGTSSILPGFDSGMVTPLLKRFKTLGIEVITDALAQSVGGQGSEREVHYQINEKKAALSADAVLVSVGRRPNTDDLNLDAIGITRHTNGQIKVNAKCQTDIPHIFAIGDVVPGLALAHKASFEAKGVADIINGVDVSVDYLAMPAVCFTDLELATVGLDLNAIADTKDRYTVSEFPWQANGRALSLGDTEGFVRLISEKDSQVLVGAQIVGGHAGDLIAECALAIEAELSVEDISLTIHPHPSLSEAIMDASELAMGLPIHM